MEPKVLDWEAPKALLEYSASSRQRFFEIILYQVILNHSDMSPHWKSFFEQFKDCFDTGILRLSFLFQIRECLGKACNGKWSKMSSYISPLHFSYLLERFLYLVGSWKSIFFTTKSSLLETLACENWKANSKSESDTDPSLKNELYCLQPFLVEFSCHTLMSEKSTLKWFEKTDAAGKKDHPSLVSRLFILVCLDDVSSFLPLECRKILGLAKPSDNFYERVSSEVDYNRLSKVFAEVLQIIENPLVILYIGEIVQPFLDILDILYLKRTECVQQNAAIDLDAKCLGDKNVSSGNIGSMIRCSQPSRSSGEEEQFMENEHEHDSDLHGSYMMSVTNGVVCSVHFYVEKVIGVLDAAIAKSNLNASSVTEIVGSLLRQKSRLRRISAHPFEICHTS
ncbi:hypothetical protein MKW94_009520 [Papaver nudicaule]|uniref:Uncharacterized protein n=1 Tax=Papaver nudicaule TaxID=74823 RepID=A0AA41VUU1_PAPNU|nr:hypothetical protein [Papaver nudicaule]